MPFLKAYILEEGISRTHTTLQVEDTIVERLIYELAFTVKLYVYNITFNYSLNYPNFAYCEKIFTLLSYYFFISFKKLIRMAKIND